MFLLEEGRVIASFFCILYCCTIYKWVLICIMSKYKKVKIDSKVLGNFEYHVGEVVLQQKLICMLGDILYVAGNGIRTVADVQSCKVDNNTCFLLANILRHAKQMVIFSYSTEEYCWALKYFLDVGIAVVLETERERHSKTGRYEELFAINMEMEGMLELCTEAVKQKMATPSI